MSSDRLEREREFHNQASADESRSGVWKYYAVQRAARTRYLELIASLSERGRVLELGCGSGSQAFALAELGREVVGIDISDATMKLATETARRRGLDGRATFIQMNAEELAFPDDEFALVCGIAVIHHLDLNAAYAEVARVLDPTGSAVFLEPLGHNPALNLFRRLTPSLRTVDEHPLTLDDLTIPDHYFADTRAEHFDLTTLAALPLRSTRWFEPLLSWLTRLDRGLFARSRILRSWSWYAILRASIPVGPPAPSGDDDG
jgi:SAM-dependent methyltransferase